MSLDLDRIYFKISATLSSMYSNTTGAFSPADICTYQYMNASFSRADYYASGIHQVDLMCWYNAPDTVHCEEIANMCALLVIPAFSDSDADLIADNVMSFLEAEDINCKYSSEDIPDEPFALIYGLDFETTLEKKDKLRLYTLMTNALSDFLYRCLNFENIEVSVYFAVLNEILGIKFDEMEDIYEEDYNDVL